MSKIELKSGDIHISGKINRIRLKEVGENKTRVAEFGILYGRNENNENLFMNCKAFRQLFDCVASIPEGSYVMAMGRMGEIRYGPQGQKFQDMLIDSICPCIPGTPIHKIGENTQKPKENQQEKATETEIPPSAPAPTTQNTDTKEKVLELDPVFVNEEDMPF